MIYALDTNIIVDLLRGRDRALGERYLANPPGNYSVPEMVRAELWFGVLMSGDPAKNGTAVESFLAPLRRLPFEDEAPRHYAEIRAHLQQAGLMIGSNDLIIAATARAHGYTLLTRNTAEFNRVPALAVESW